jgi:hypothetical protein
VIKPVVSPTGIFILLAIVMPAFTQPLGEDDVDRGFRNCLWGLTRNSVNLIGGSLARKKQEKARKKIQCAYDTFFFISGLTGTSICTLANMTLHMNFCIATFFE